MFSWYTSPVVSFLVTFLSWLVVGIGFFGGWYWFWRKAKEEHFEEIEAADAFLRASLLGLIGSRLSYILFHFADFGFLLPRWIDIFRYPGLWTAFGFAVAFAWLWRYAQRQKLDVWEVWDFYSIFLAWYFTWYWLSLFLIGSAGGVPTGVSWYGFRFPQRLELAHPVQLYAALLWGLLARYLVWAEPRYRFFFWYRSKKRTAKTGYLFCMLLIWSGFASFLLSFFQYPFFLVFGFDLNQVLQALIFLGGCVLLYVRSGRTFWSGKENKGSYVTSHASSTE